MTDILKFKTLQLHATIQNIGGVSKIVPVIQNHDFEFNPAFEREKISLKNINKIIRAQSVLVSLETGDVFEKFKWYSN